MQQFVNTNLGASRGLAWMDRKRNRSRRDQKAVRGAVCKHDADRARHQLWVKITTHHFSSESHTTERKQAMASETTAQRWLQTPSKSTSHSTRFLQTVCRRFLFHRTSSCVTLSKSTENNIGDQGACALAEALKVNTALTSLQLSSSFLFLCFSVWSLLEH